MNELKPCPFCGCKSVSITEEFIFLFSKSATIKCERCGRKIKRRTPKRAVKAWNTRTPKERGGEK